MTGEFELPEAAAAAVEGLIDDDIDADEISVSVENPSGQHLIAVRQVDGLLRGALSAAGVGALLGLAVGVAFALGVLDALTPAFLKDGAVAALLRGASLGAMAGFMLGVIRGLTQEPDGVSVPPARLRPGRVTVAVDADGAHAQHARDLMRRCGAGHVQG